MQNATKPMFFFQVEEKAARAGHEPAAAEDSIYREVK
jgi:hypothetical protein